MSAFRFDVTLVLNVHDERRFLRRTMMSIERAVAFARPLGLTFELIIVMDRAETPTRSWFDSYDFAPFQEKGTVVVDYGSLGPSRNAGIAAASGEFICTCDGDDLVSENMLLEMYLACSSRGAKTLVFPNYLYEFGDTNHLAVYHGTDKVSKLGFFTYHPYVSRVFTRRTTFDQLSYPDVNRRHGIAYEDWSFNMEAIAAGYEAAIATNTILFYRKRPNSLLRQAAAGGTKIVGPSSYFAPERYLTVCAKDFDRFVVDGADTIDHAEVRREFVENPVCMQLALWANRIDPAIDLGVLSWIGTTSNRTGYLEASAAYYRLCKGLIGDRFTDVVLLPFLTTGGGEKYILNAINGLAQLDPSRNFLVVTGEPIERHAWIERLPQGSVFVDLNQACAGLGEDVIDLVTLRIIQAVAPGSRIYVKSCPYAFRFIMRYGRLLEPDHDIIDFRFSDPVITVEGEAVARGFNFDFISENFDRLKLIVTDNEAITHHDRTRFGIDADKIRTLYTLCAPTVRTVPNLDRPRTNRILWASRLDPEKRPGLLIKIARAAANWLPQLSFDVFGSAVMGGRTDGFEASHFDELDNLTYRGAYSGFESLPHQDYDALLYTTAYDGLPNVILEGLASGLPVIAPDIGGISEAVGPETGFLIEPAPDDDELVSHYLSALTELAEADLREMRTAALRLIETRHSEEAFLRNLSAVFDLFPSVGIGASDHVGSES